MSKIHGPCEIGETEGPEIKFRHLVEFFKKYKGYIVFSVLLAGALLSLFSSSMDSIINSQLFFPERRLAATPDHLGLAYEDLAIETRDKLKLHAWWIPAPQAKAALLFFHGNAGNISHRLDNLKLLNGLGLSCLIPDYRGYGRSQGSPNEKGFYLDARASYGAAVHLAQKHGLPLVIFGRSLGGAAAVEVGGAKQAAGVILESTFTNLGDMAKVFFGMPGLDKLLSGRFNSMERIGAISAPLLFFHGDKDEIVPYSLGRELYEKATAPKEFVTLAGARHNDTVVKGGAAYLAKISAFVDSVAEK